MKIRIAENKDGFWVEQRTCLGWSKCRSLSDLKSCRSIRFMIRNADDYMFDKKQEAEDYARNWWITYSRRGRQFKQKINKTTYSILDIEKNYAKFLLKEFADDATD